MKTIALAAIAAAATAVSAPASAQDLNAYFAQQNAIMQAQMQQAQNRIVQQNVNDPRVVAMYRQALAQGYRGSLRDFAYGYAATGGYTPEGRAFYAQNEARNQRNEQAAAQRYQDAVRARGNAVSERNAHAAQNQYDAGLGLAGRQRYADPVTGQQTERSYIPNGRDTGYDQRTGRYYGQDQYGNYVSCGQDGCFRVNPAR